MFEGLLNLPWDVSNRETFFENPLLRGLFVSPESGRAYDAAKEQKLNAAQFDTLRGDYTTPQLPAPGVLQMTPENLALSDQIYGAENRQPGQFKPTPEYFARAAAIPGYQQLAQGMQQGVQAMDRQIQEQGWSVNPASNQAQQVALERQRTEAQINNYLEQQKIARGQLGVSQGNLGLNQMEFMAKYMPDGKGGFMPRPAAMEPPKGYVNVQDPETGQYMMSPAPGTKEWRDSAEQLDTLRSGITGANTFDKYLGEFGTGEIWNRTAARGAEAERQRIITAMGVLSNMGVLQPGDLDRLTKQLVDPTDWTGGITGTAGARTAVQEVNQRLQEAYKARIRAMPTLRGYHQQPKPPK